MEFLSQWWQRVSAMDAPLTTLASWVVLGVAVALVVLAWPLTRTVVTICHEAGHAVIAVLVGRKLAGIRVHSDTSGLTVSRGRPRGPGMVLMLFAGYASASVIGVGVAWLAWAGRSAAALWLIVVLLALMLLRMRNVYGALVVLATGVVLALASWFAPAPVLPWLAHTVAWTLLLAGPRPVIEVAGNRSPGTDGAQLARLTHLPRVLWVLAWLLVTVGALLVGGWLLLPLAL
ncbi:MAG: M50 family metallopeptidase [Propionibacteriales bacterium]|nr:M50 family metallopeptidase [Propionibacteriales bacterium]